MIKFLKNLFLGSSGPANRYFVYQVKCKRCGEVIVGRVDTTNDLSIEYEGNQEVYYVRKVLMGSGSNRCYQQIEVGMKFDQDHNLLEKTIDNKGEFVE